MANKPVHLKRLQARSKRLTVRRVARDTYVCASKSRPSLQHVVTVGWQQNESIHARCTCPWSVYGGFGCVHVMAVLRTIAERQNKRISFWSTHEEAERQRHRVLRLTGDGWEEIFITSRPGKGKRAA
jgi:uncharacterized Zn finger protein